MGYFKHLFSDASNSAGLKELSIAFLFDDNPIVRLGDAARIRSADSNSITVRSCNATKIFKCLLMIVTLSDHVRIVGFSVTGFLDSSLRCVIRHLSKYSGAIAVER